jgi:hypothetical protein
MATDLLTLGVTIDPTGAQQGARSVGSALDGIQSKFLASENSGLRFNGSLRELNKTVSGTTQAAQGVKQLADAFSSASVSGIAFASIGAALDFSKLYDDYRQVAEATTAIGSATAATTNIVGAYGEVISTTAVKTTAATTASKGFIAVLAANPLIAIAGVLAAIGAAFALIGEKAKASAFNVEELNKAASRLNAELSVGKSFGRDDLVLSAYNKQRDRLFSVATDITEAKSNPSVDELSKSLGITKEQLVSRLYDQGVLSPGKDGKVTVPYSAGLKFNKRGFTGFDGEVVDQSALDAGEFSFTTTGATDFLSRESVLAKKQINPLVQKQEDYEQRLQYERDKRAIDADNERRRIAAAEKVAQQLELASRYAENIGQSFGASLYDVIAGVNTLRNALASLVGGAARSGLSSLAGSALGALPGVFGKTGTQVKADGVDPAPTAPNE